MSNSIASKNLYELLGNDPELDPDREPEPPTKAIDKPVQRAGKRNAGAEGPAAKTDAPRAAAGGRGGRQEGFNRGDQAGPQNNRAERRDDGLRQDRHPDRLREPREHRDGDGRGRGRGSRGGRGFGGRGPRGGRDDRHSHTGIAEHDKQAAKGWGGQDGQSEWADEKAGDAIATAEVTNDATAGPDTTRSDPAFATGPADTEPRGQDEAPQEEEEKTKSYDQYLAELAEKRQALSGNTVEMRKANEGSKQKFPEGKAFDRAQEDFFAGSGGKARKERENKSKNLLTMEGQYYAPADMGGRGGGRGGRGDSRGGRGGFRGDREGRGDRGEGRGRGGRGRGGDFGGRGGRGGERGGERGGPRGLNPQDESAFPSLGGK